MHKRPLFALILGFAHGASDSSCHPSPTFDLPLTRGEMAGMLGITIETVSRRLSRIGEQQACNRMRLRRSTAFPGESMSRLLLILCLLAWRCRSIWGGVLVHVCLAVSMDVLSLLQRGALPTTLLP